MIVRRLLSLFHHETDVVGDTEWAVMNTRTVPVTEPDAVNGRLIWEEMSSAQRASHWGSM